MCDYHKNQPEIKDIKTPMPNSMGKDKLLQELAYLDQAEYIDDQAYAQLVEIVEQHFILEKSIEHLVAHIKAGSEPDSDTGQSGEAKAESRCANCGKMTAETNKIMGKGILPEDEWVCSQECYDEYEEKGCPLESGGYRKQALHSQEGGDSE